MLMGGGVQLVRDREGLLVEKYDTLTPLNRELKKYLDKGFALNVPLGSDIS